MSKLTSDDTLNEGEEVELYKIVLTGGPCAGKTTAMDRLSSFLRERGFRVFTVPEAATMLFTNGVPFTDLATEEGKLDFQITLLGLQMNLEDSFERLARASGKACVLLCDRGACDGKAYISTQGWNTILQSHGIDNEITVREGRYNAVFHMVTAAKGASDFYTLANNSARSEPPEAAIELDTQLQRAWNGHPSHIVFDNTTDFHGKMERVVDQMARIVGLPLVHRNPSKYILLPVPDMTDTTPARDLTATLTKELGPDSVHMFEVEKIYVIHANKRHSERSGQAPILQYSFIRRRTQNGYSVYGHTQVKRHPDGERVEVKRIINVREYEWIKNTYADPTRHKVVQRRYFFLWEGQTFNIHQYVRPWPNLCVLHCQVPRDAEKSTTFPPFLDVGQPLDEDGDYSAYTVSRIEGVATMLTPPSSPKPSSTSRSS